WRRLVRLLFWARVSAGVKRIKRTTTIAGNCIRKETSFRVIEQFTQHSPIDAVNTTTVESTAVQKPKPYRPGRYQRPDAGTQLLGMLRSQRQARSALPPS